MAKAPIATRKTTKKASRAATPSAVATVSAAQTNTPAPSDLKPPRKSKALALRRSLLEPGGASITSIMRTTGWQAHTVRAALSGLRKQGWSIQRRAEDGVTIYFIDRDAPPPDGTGGAVYVVDPAKPVEAAPEASGVVAGNGLAE